MKTENRFPEVVHYNVERSAKKFASVQVLFGWHICPKIPMVVGLIKDSKKYQGTFLPLH